MILANKDLSNFPFLRMIRKFLINSATEDPFTQAIACVDGSFADEEGDSFVSSYDLGKQRSEQFSFLEDPQIPYQHCGIEDRFR
jgi:hypothetical protein